MSRLKYNIRGVAIRAVSGIIVAALFLLLLEGVLRLLPLDRWERDYPNVSYPLFVPGEGAFADSYVTNPHFRGAMSSHSFKRVKPPGVKRVFVLGGSAALGWPGPNPSAFSGYMQRALDRAFPGQFEIISAAAMSYGSHRVLDLLADVVQYEPDVIVVWSGNNEYVERNVFSPYARGAKMRGLQRVLRHSSVYRSLRLALHAVVPTLVLGPAGGDLTDLRKLPQVSRGMLGRSDNVDREVLENYRSNLNEIGRTIRASGATGILCTVPVNLSFWAPHQIQPTFPASRSSESWLALQDKAIRLNEQSASTEAATVLREMMKLAPNHAPTHYLLGKQEQRLSHNNEAMVEFRAARDLDSRPIRALGSFEEAVRATASREGLRLADLENVFVQASGTELVGLDLFLDYVHPNEAGHKLAAITVLPQLLTVDQQSEVFKSKLAQLVWQDDWSAQNPYNPADMLYAVGMTYQNNGDLDRAEKAYLGALQADPGFSEPAGNLGVIFESRGELAVAQKYYQMAVLSDPQTWHAIGLARVQYHQGELKAAREIAERVLREGYVDMALYDLLGNIALDEARFVEAMGFFRQAQAMGEDDPVIQAKIDEINRIEKHAEPAQASPADRSVK